ncbi:MAG TPA: CAP domain-containing protein [Candidatus Saccharimonadales bacterium]
MVLVAEHKKRVPLHEKKRTGQHHAQGKHYSKPYWPYLPLLLIVCGGLLLSGAWSRQGKVLGYAIDVSPTSLLQDTNTQRVGDHEASLTLNTALTNAAQSKAEDMVAHDYWSHVSPSGEQPWQFITAAGYNYALAGENLAYGFGTSDAVVNAWMNSAEHRANILNGDYKDVGFGIADVPDFQGKGPETIVVAMYGEPAGAAVAAANSQQAVLGAEATQSVPRLDSFGFAQDPWLFGLITALAGAAAGIFIVRHALLWRRALVKSEAFVVKHRLFDVILVAMGILGFVLTRAAGNIG